MTFTRFLYAPQRSAPLTAGDAVEITRWADIVAKYYRDELAFAGRRVVSAATARTSLEDSLVDCVIAWENLVGGAPETTFRTSAALACLLESDAPKRLRLQDRLATIYDARSDVVHGRKGGDSSKWAWRLEPGTEKVKLDKVANEALEVAVRSLKAIMENRSDLIPLKASARSERILMGVKTEPDAE